jgi:hypothetical protein
VVEQQPIEEHFVRILQSAQIDVSLQVVVLSLVGAVSTDDLLINALDVGRQKAVQAELASLLHRKGRAFVQTLAVEEIHPAGQICALYRSLLCGHRRASFHFSRFRNVATSRAKRIDFRQIDDSVAATAKNCFQYKEAFGLLKSDRP